MIYVRLVLLLTHYNNTAYFFFIRILPLAI